MLKVAGELRDINQIHEWLNSCALSYHQMKMRDTITVDLSLLNFVTPLGCTALLSSLCFLDKYFYLDTLVPRIQRIEDTNVVSYMERMNFFQLCPNDVRLAFEYELDMGTLYNRKRYNKEDSLNEITLCSSDTDVEKFDSSLKRILRNKGIAANQVSNISRIVTELGLNSVEHGKYNDVVSCFYCVQSYRGGKWGLLFVTME